MNNINGKDIILKLVEIDDSAFVLKLRSDNTLNKYLSKVSDSLELQKEWIINYKIREQEKVEFYYKIMDKNNHNIGLVRLYNINYSLKELTFGSFILINEKPKLSSLETLILTMEISFKILKMEKVLLDVRVDNDRAKNFYIRFGFDKYDSNLLDEFYEISKEKYEKLFNDKYYKYL